MKIPAFCRMEGETVKQFKRRKRKEIRAVLTAFDTFRNGCAYVPGYKYVLSIDDGLEAIKAACAVKAWK